MPLDYYEQIFLETKRKEMQPIIDFFGENLIASVLTLAGLATTLTELLKGALHPNKIWTLVISLIVGSGLSVAAYFGGFLEGAGSIKWLSLVLSCVVCTFSANGAYEWIKNLFTKKKEESK